MAPVDDLFTWSPPPPVQPVKPDVGSHAKSKAPDDPIDRRCTPVPAEIEGLRAQLRDAGEHRETVLGAILLTYRVTAAELLEGI